MIFRPKAEIFRIFEVLRLKSSPPKFSTSATGGDGGASVHLYTLHIPKATTGLPLLPSKIKNPGYAYAYIFLSGSHLDVLKRCNIKTVKKNFILEKKQENYYFNDK